MSDKPVAKCPVCGAKASRLISGGQGLIFKGSGFYITDYGKDGKGPRKDADASPGTDTKAESKSDAAPASKSEPKSDTSPSKGDGKRDPKPSGPSKPGKSDAS